MEATQAVKGLSWATCKALTCLSMISLYVWQRLHEQNLQLGVRTQSQLIGLPGNKLQLRRVDYGK